MKWRDVRKTHVRSRAFVNLHRNSEDRLSSRVDVPTETLVGRRDSFLDVRRLIGVSTDFVRFVVAAAAGRLVSSMESILSSSKGLGRDDLAESTSDDGLCLLEDDLSSSSESSSEFDSFQSGGLDEGGRSSLNSSNNSTVLLELLDGEEDEIGDS